MANKLMEQAVALSQQAVSGARRLQTPTAAPQIGSNPYAQVAQNNISTPEKSTLSIQPAYGNRFQEMSDTLTPVNGKAQPTNNPIETIKSKLAKVESGGNYTAASKTSSASGKYQYLNSSWNNYGGYKRAADAPPEIQEKRMTEDAARLLKRYNGNEALVAVAHFQGQGTADKILQNPALWEKKDANGLTTREYVNRVLGSSPSTLTPVGNNKKAPTGKANPRATELLATAQKTLGVSNLGIWGDEAHKKRKSDHNTGDAVDLGIKSQDQGMAAVKLALQQPGVKYIIFGKDGTGYLPDGRVIPHYSSLDHSTHVHVSFTR